MARVNGRKRSISRLKRLTILGLGLILTLVVLNWGAEFSSSTAQVEKIEMMTASWYGPRFHGKRTASGTVYDMNQISAAHRTLGFGTRVLLVNPSNGRQVKVEINDRGPYVKGRDIDLSLAAAEALGIKKQGLAQLYAVIVD